MLFGSTLRTYIDDRVRENVHGASRVIKRMAPQAMLLSVSTEGTLLRDLERDVHHVAIPESRTYDSTSWRCTTQTGTES